MYSIGCYTILYQEYNHLKPQHKKAGDGCLSGDMDWIPSTYILFTTVTTGPGDSTPTSGLSGIEYLQMIHTHGENAHTHKIKIILKTLQHKSQ